MCVSRPQGSVDSGCALGAVVSLREKLRNILFVEHFECESYVVKNKLIPLILSAYTVFSFLYCMHLIIIAIFYRSLLHYMMYLPNFAHQMLPQFRTMRAEFIVTDRFKEMEGKGRGGGGEEAKMTVRNKEMLLMRASKLCELSKSTLKYTVNNKEQNTEKLVSIRSYS